MTFTRAIIRVTALTAWLCIAAVALTEMLMPVLPLKGDVLLFSSSRASSAERYAPGDLWVMDLERWWFHRLTESPRGDMMPRWSPDGERIAFMSNRDGRQVDVYLIDTDGTDLLNLSDHPDNNTAPAWSPDSRRVMFSLERWGPDYSAHIHIVGTDGSDLHSISEGQLGYMYPAWSPDGSQVAFVLRYLDTWDGDLYVMNADGTSIRSLTTTLNNMEANPSWSPDGRYIAYDAGTDSGRQVFIVDAATGDIRQVTHTSYNVQPAWSPDGTRLAFASARDGNDEIYVLDLDAPDDSHAHRMTYHPGRDMWPAWAPLP